MARSSILGGERAPVQPRGRDIDTLGPSDSSDTGSDVQATPDFARESGDEDAVAAQPGHGSDSDAAGTGERGSALPDDKLREGGDIAPDRVADIGPGAAPGDPGLAEVDDMASDSDTEDEETPRRRQRSR